MQQPITLAHYLHTMLIYDGKQLGGDIELFRKRYKVFAKAVDGKLPVDSEYLRRIVAELIEKRKVILGEIPDSDFFARRTTQVNRPKIQAPAARRSRRKSTGERAVFLQIWEERPHVSEIGGEPLYPYGHYLWYNQFMHVLAKGNYEILRLEKRNILLGTPVEHKLQTERPDLCVGPKWEVFWRREAEMRLYLQEIRGNDTQ